MSLAGTDPVAASPPGDWRVAGFGVYVHWPFCLAKCPYCDFNSHVSASVDQDQWRTALVAEVRAAKALTGPRTVDTVFFGGGTPSLMPAETVGAIIEAIDAEWGLAEGAEVTLEANPTSVEAVRFRGYASAGVNRVSMGVQALNDPDLKALGRMHSAAEARGAFDVARSVFSRVSFDLIYARQGQSLQAWEVELAEALAMAIDHLSLYQLTIEQGTRFGDLAARGRLRDLPDDDLSADMYALTQDITAGAGMLAYEISNHARPGAESRHNRIYWRYGDYAGIGPGAHGRLTLDGARWGAVTPRDPAAWLKTAGQFEWEAVPNSDAASELLMMGLRLAEGVDRGRYERLAGASLDDAAIRELVSDGFLEAGCDRIKATLKGRPVLNALLRRLLV